LYAIMADKPAIHAGRPHVSASDPKTHTTITYTDPATGKTLGTEHSSTLAGIAIGSAAFAAAQEAKDGKS
jgi:hypothetical protein